MASEKRNLIGELTLVGEGDDGEGSSSRGLPVERDVLGVDLEKVRVPGVVARLVSGRSEKSCGGWEMV